MLQGLRTVGLDVVDLQAAKAWYTELLGFGPYFDQPVYVGFDVGGFELGMHPAKGAHPGPGGATTYWAVADLDGASERLQQLGATLVQAPLDVGEGIRVASVRDPFGNLLGLIHNPVFRAEVGARVAASGEVLSERAITLQTVVRAAPTEVFALWAASEGLSLAPAPQPRRPADRRALRAAVRPGPAPGPAGLGGLPDPVLPARRAAVVHLERAAVPAHAAAAHLGGRAVRGGG